MLDVSLPVCRAGGTNVAGGTVYGREETPTDCGHGYENLFEETTAAEEELDGDDNQTATEILAAHTCSAAADVATDHFTFEGETMSFDEAVQEKVFRVLALLDEHRCSLAMQNSLLHILLANVHKDPISVVPNWVNLQLRQASSNHHELSLARLLTLAGSNWKGGDKGECTPASLARTAETFQHRGLVDPQKWDMCIGDGSFTHGPVLYGPNNLQTTCEVRNCAVRRNQRLRFDYIPLESVLKPLFRSRTFCYDLLKMWRHRSEWLGRELQDAPETITEFWHGSKVREYQSFRDPSKEYALPIVCPNPACAKAYRIWPTTCESLLEEQNYDENADVFKFPCETCADEVSGSPVYVKLQVTTAQKDCWTVEIVILNAGKIPLPENMLGDHLAQCKVSGVASGGYNGCRRDKVIERFLMTFYDMVIMTYSGCMVLNDFIEKAEALARAIDVLDVGSSSPCLLAAKRGLGVGPRHMKENVLEAEDRWEKCLRAFWANKGLLTVTTEEFFRPTIIKLRSVHVNGNLFKIGGPKWKVLVGRSDGSVSLASEALSNLPDDTFTFQQLVSTFAKKGLNEADMVVLSGAHTSGLVRNLPALSNLPDDTFTFQQLVSTFAKKDLNEADMVVFSGAHTIGLGRNKHQRNEAIDNCPDSEVPMFETSLFLTGR
ncbi:hypothetical protein R1sor_024131 [Riccia sorocarpa]|uniref:Plant heme peroxidase family profile domain-containing protein n=1 Tax=Riccia sorocarpa TaxID=122646 RepID=A0ABD3GSV6_9MARC